MLNYKAILTTSLLLPLTASIAQDDFESFNEKPATVREQPAAQTTPSNNPQVDVQVPEESPSEITPRTRSRRNRPTPQNEREKSFRARESNKFSTQEQKVFGRESIVTDQKKDAKYVNLNPETAFGPEIIESFDFPNTDILEITKHMQKLTGINLILDKDVKGKVSISAPTPITVGDAWKAYLVSLNMAGYSLIKTGEFYRIINSRDIRYTPTKIYTGDYIPDVENYMMKIIALKYVDASEIVRNFRPFMSRYGRILDIKQTNTIIITDTGTNINRLMKLVKFLDVPGFEETMQIMKVKYTSAQEIAKLLDSILKEERTSSRSRSKSRRSDSGSENSGATISKIIAEPRTNSIIAMANAEGAKQLKDLIAKLDVPTASSGSGKIQVYYLQHGNAEELAQTLTTLISGAKNTGGKTSASSSRTSRLTSRSTNEIQGIFSEEVKVTADKATNSLVVTASPTDWLTVKEVIRKLDIPRDQVYVEGLILETTVRKNSSFGTSYIGLYGEGLAERFGFGANNFIDLQSGNFQNLSGFFGGFGIGSAKDFTINLGGQEVDLKASSVNGLIKAIAGKTNSNVLATPQILVMDNTEGVFEVGETVPTQSQTIGTGGVSTSNITPQKITMVLKITPQINKVTRFIKLKIDQKIEDFTNRDVAIPAGGGVATTIRSAITEVMVRDQDTIAMDGLLRDKINDQVSKIPLLGDIPVLGWLFKSKQKEHEKVNLMFFLTPKIISPYGKVAAKNTLNLIEQRNKRVTDDNIGTDYHQEAISELVDKVEKQARGPLYTEEQAQLYRNEEKNSEDTSNLTIDDMKEPEVDDSGLEEIDEEF